MMQSQSLPNVKTKYLLPLLMILLVSCRQHTNSTYTEPVQKKWYSNVVIYNLDVDAFKDSDGDGTGDFKGLTQRLGYLDSLGINVIWLSPFQPTPNEDDGYDVSDYYGIDPRLGNKADFDAFMKAAKAKGLRVMMDVVLNHTSSEHPWFRAARADTNSKYHKWYLWADKRPKDWNKGMVFPGIQNETWSYDDASGKYYFHRFYDFQPDLNYERADVRQMAKDVLAFWLKQGMDGFRLDAVPFVIDMPETGSEKPQHMPTILTDISTAVRKIKPDVMLLGEANVTAEENKIYFGSKGERLQMMFNFYANQFLFYSLAKNEPEAFVKALEEFRSKPANCQWAFFLRNHDETDLARLTGKQRQLVFDKMGPEPSMQLYNRGIRRRLAPMLNNTDQLKMTYSLLFSSPGAQVIRYGEETGMGDDLTLRERLSVRTPMQWDSTVNAGFSSTKGRTFRPVIAYGKYGYKTVNVAAEWKDPGSLLSFISQLTAVRSKHPEIGLGNWEVLNSGSSNILLMLYNYHGKRMLAAHNFSNEEQVLKLDRNMLQGKELTAVFGNVVKEGYKEKGQRDRQLDPSFKMKGYAFQWFSF